MNNIQILSHYSKKTDGKDWLSRFRLRHKDVLSLRKLTGTSFSRALGFNKKNVDEFLMLVMEEKNVQLIKYLTSMKVVIVQSKCPKVFS